MSANMIAHSRRVPFFSIDAPVDGPTVVRHKVRAGLAIVQRGVLGIAYLGTVCNVSAFGYGLSAATRLSFSEEVLTAAHELGHNWNATHCNEQAECRIMCASNGGCNSQTSFAPLALSQISSFRSTRTCLDALADPLAVPFIDTFPGATVDQTRWSYNDGVFHSSAGLNLPSPPRAMNLDALNDGEFGDDQIRSNDCQERPHQALL